jgi:hypothetical protein
MIEDNYDPELGPNKVLRCKCCSAKLLPLEICWCQDKFEEDEDEREDI